MAGLLSPSRADRRDHPLVAADAPAGAAATPLPALAALDDAGPVLQVPGAGCLALSRDQVRLMRHVAYVAVRPAHWLMTPGQGSDGLHARIERVEPLGGVSRVHCRLAGPDGCTVVVETAWPGSETLPRGLRVRLQVRPWDLQLLDARGQRLDGQRRAGRPCD